MRPKSIYFFSIMIIAAQVSEASGSINSICEDFSNAFNCCFRVRHHTQNAGNVNQTLPSSYTEVKRLLNISSEFTDEFEHLCANIANFMKETITQNSGRDHEYILDLTLQRFRHEEFMKLRQAIPDYRSYIQNTLYNSSHNIIFETPDTNPQGGGEVLIFKYGERLTAAIKIYDLGDEDDDIRPLQEIFSWIYVKKIIGPKIANSICYLPNLQYFFGCDEKIIMILEGASGQSLESICSEYLKVEPVPQPFKTALKANAVALAQFHKNTEINPLNRVQIKVLLQNSYNNSLMYGSFSADPVTLKQKIIDNLLKLQSKLHLRLQKNLENLSLNRKTCTTHGDAHVGNIFYNPENGKVTLIDYETAFNSFKNDGDPFKDIGCFLGSIWFKISASNQQNAFETGNEIRLNFILEYLKQIGYFCTYELTEENISRDLDIIDPIKFYMWARMTYSGELKDLSEEAKFKLEKMFDEDFSGEI